MKKNNLNDIYVIHVFNEKAYVVICNGRNEYRETIRRLKNFKVIGCYKLKSRNFNELSAVMYMLYGDTVSECEMNEYCCKVDMEGRCDNYRFF